MHLHHWLIILSFKVILKRDLLDMHSNSYTIIFTSVVTIVLGGFLSVAAGTLKETQELNVKNDSKKNILASLGYKPEG